MTARHFKYKENTIILMGDINDILYFQNISIANFAHTRTSAGYQTTSKPYHNDLQ